MDIRGKRFLVIGGAGFIGSHTIDKLLKEDIKEIILYDNFSRGNLINLKQAMKDDRLKICEYGNDILLTDTLNKVTENIDGVFHFAALWLLHCQDFPRSAFETNIKGTFNVLEACKNSQVKKIVYSSSASVYGDAIYEPIDEDHPLNNKNFYGATKISCEAILRAFYYQFGLNYVALRYMNVYGERQDHYGAYTSVIMKMIKALNQDKTIKIIGDGSEKFDFIAVEDCAEANILAMKSDIEKSNLNIGTGIGTSLFELANLILKNKNSNKKIIYVKNTNKTLVKSRVGSVEKAFNQIGFKAKILFKDGLKNTIRWVDKVSSN